MSIDSSILLLRFIIQVIRNKDAFVGIVLNIHVKIEAEFVQVTLKGSDWKWEWTILKFSFFSGIPDLF